MQSKVMAISKDNGFDVLVVWERQGQKWKLLLVTRPQRAIALYWQKPEARLVFPAGVNPNSVGKATLPEKRKYERKKQQPPARSRKRKLSKAPKVKSKLGHKPS